MSRKRKPGNGHHFHLRRKKRHRIAKLHPLHVGVHREGRLERGVKAIARGLKRCVREACNLGLRHLFAAHGIAAEP